MSESKPHPDGRADSVQLGLSPFTEMEHMSSDARIAMSVSKLLQNMHSLNSDTDMRMAESELRQLLNESGWPSGTVPKHGMSAIHTSIKELFKKIHALEVKASIQDSLIDELRFKANLAPHGEQIDKIMIYAKMMFKDLDFVTELHYIPLEDGTLKMIIIHDLDDRVKALEQTQRRQMKVEHAFENTQFQMLLLHASEVNPDHLQGARQVAPKLTSECS